MGVDIDKIFRPDNINKGYNTHLCIGDFNTDHILTGNRGDNTDTHGAQRECQSIGQVHDFTDLDSGVRVIAALQVLLCSVSLFLPGKGADLLSLLF